MSRLVVPTPRENDSIAGITVSEAPADDYKDRLVKYIPAESVALYAFIDKLLISYYGIDASGSTTAQQADNLLTFLPWVFLILGLIGTPIYLFKQRLTNQPWKLHATISTIAFLLWAYTLGGSIFIINGWYNILIAGIAAPVFTFIAGWFEPKPS